MKLPERFEATPMTNQQVLLKSRPSGAPRAENFEIASAPVPALGPGHVLRRTIYLSLDPYMRGRMSDAPSYATPVSVGQVMVGHTVSQVLESRHPSFAPGDIVAGYDGWQEYAASPGDGLRKVDSTMAPISTAVGVLGMPGQTAYVGLLDIGQPVAGETVVVSAASGAVGSVVGQIAKIKGCRAVGVAGSRDKCDFVVGELGFDACVNHRSPAFRDELAASCPSGIDVYFENVGGAVLAAVLRLLNQRARIPLCGLISEYSADKPPAGPNLRPLLVKRAMIRGFIVSDHPDRFPAFQRDCAAWIRDGRIKYREDVVAGLEHAPGAFLRLFDGRNFGKLLIRVSADPTQRS
jgi:NADPH-dependent curcumin reductase CurA